MKLTVSQNSENLDMKYHQHTAAIWKKFRANGNGVDIWVKQRWACDVSGRVTVWTRYTCPLNIVATPLLTYRLRVGNYNYWKKKI